MAFKLSKTVRQPVRVEVRHGITLIARPYSDLIATDVESRVYRLLSDAQANPAAARDILEAAGWGGAVPDMGDDAAWGLAVLVIRRRLVAEAVISGWDGIEDDDGRPMDFTPENLVWLLSDWPEIAVEFAVAYEAKRSALAMEKNGSASSPDGVAAAGSHTAGTVGKTDHPAPGAPATGKASAARKSSTRPKARKGS